MEQKKAINRQKNESNYYSLIPYYVFMVFLWKNIIDNKKESSANESKKLQEVVYRVQIVNIFPNFILFTFCYTFLYSILIVRFKN